MNLKQSLSLLFPMLAAVSAMAQGEPTNGIHVVRAEAKPTPPSAQTATVSLSIENRGASADVLLSATSAVAQSIEIHHSGNHNGMMEMRPLADGVTLPAGKTTDLATLGDHLMLIGLSKPLTSDDSIPLTLHFRTAGDVPLEVHVTPSSSEEMPMDHMQMH